MKRSTFLSVLGMAPAIGMTAAAHTFAQRSPQTATFKVIDSHVHVVDSGKPVKQMMNDWHEGYTACGFDSICFAVNTCEGIHAIHRNLLAFLYKAIYPAHGYVFASLDYHLPGSNRPEWNFTAQAERLIRIGADGFKMYEGKPNTRKVCGNKPLHSAAYAGFYELLQQRGLPLAIHMADPPDFWDRDRARAGQVASNWYFGDAAHATWQEIYDECISVISTHPKLRIILPQFGYLRPEEIEALLLQFKNLYIDIAPGGTFDHIGNEAPLFRNLAARYPDRFLFACSGVASDLAGANARKSVMLRDGIHRLALPESTESAILSGNFLSLCQRKQVNMDALKEYAQAVKKCIDGFPARPADQPYMMRTMEVISFIENMEFLEVSAASAHS